MKGMLTTALMVGGALAAGAAIAVGYSCIGPRAKVIYWENEEEDQPCDTCTIA